MKLGFSPFLCPCEVNDTDIRLSSSIRLQLNRRLNDLTAALTS